MTLSKRILKLLTQTGTVMNEDEIWSDILKTLQKAKKKGQFKFVSPPTYLQVKLALNYLADKAGKLQRTPNGDLYGLPTWFNKSGTVKSKYNA